MAKKKAKKGQQQTFVSPENYIRQKARTLKIKSCYISDLYDEIGMGFVIVAREHTGGNITFGAYLVDRFCLGVKDTFFRMRMSPYEFEDYLDKAGMAGLREISYEEAHNIIYGAVEFAQEAGIEPHKNFALTQYILEEDNEDIPLIEYEYGKDGQHYLMANSMLEASKYLPKLRKNLGDNFKWSIGDGGDDDGLDDDEDDDDGFSDSVKYRPLFKKYGPETEYTYRHPEYPSTKEIDNPIVEEILCDPKNAMTLSKNLVDTLLALPHESLRHDLEQLIMYHIGIGCDGIPSEVSDADFVGVVCNAIILLAEVGNEESSLDVVLEVLRQSEDFLDYHIGDSGSETFVPAIYKLGRNRLDKLMSFMNEEGLYDMAKIYVVEAVAFIVQKNPERRSEIVEWFRELTAFATEKLPETQCVDSVLSGFIVNSLVDLQAKELLPEIKAMFDTGLVDEGICGGYDDVVKMLSAKEPPSLDVYFTDVYEWFESMRRIFGN